VLQLAKGPVRVGLVSSNGITIKDVSAEAGGSSAGAAAAAGEGDAAMAADEDYARRLQAKMDAQSMGNASRCATWTHRIFSSLACFNLCTSPPTHGPTGTAAAVASSLSSCSGLTLALLHIDPPALGSPSLLCPERGTTQQAWLHWILHAYRVVAPSGQLQLLQFYFTFLFQPVYLRFLRIVAFDNLAIIDWMLHLSI